jgi:hypothetical protein
MWQAESLWLTSPDNGRASVDARRKVKKLRTRHDWLTKPARSDLLMPVTFTFVRGASLSTAFCH